MIINRRLAFVSDYLRFAKKKEARRFVGDPRGLA